MYLTFCPPKVSGPSMTPLFSSRFRRHLHAYRAALSLEWSDSTVHPDFSERPDLPPSAGQCGVSSAWLIQELPWILRLRARYCVGDVVVDGEVLEFHCWIEIGRATAPGRWVIDVTCDHVTVGLQAIRKLPGVRTATVFGQSMHLLVDKNVSEESVRAELAKYNIPHVDIRPIAPSLEDVFVALTNTAANGGPK